MPKCQLTTNRTSKETSFLSIIFFNLFEIRGCYLQINEIGSRLQQQLWPVQTIFNNKHFEIKTVCFHSRWCYCCCSPLVFFFFYSDYTCLLFFLVAYVIKLTASNRRAECIATNKIKCDMNVYLYAYNM